MKRSKKHLLRSLAVAMIVCAGFAACTQDDESGSTTLPEGKYPLEISSVTMSVESSEQPWGTSQAPQTRVSENPDGNSSKWEDGDKIYVQVGSRTPGTYTYQGGKLTVVDGDSPAYWASNADGQTVKAWHTSPNHTSGDGTTTTVTLSDQKDGLAYVLTNSAPVTANFGQSIDLKFSHALAKIRVVLTGKEVGDDTSVSIESYTSCTVNQVTVQGTTPGEIKMRRTAKGTFEANVVPGYEIKQFKINDGNWIDLTTSVTPVAGNWHKIGIDVKPEALTPAEPIEIKDNGEYTITGSGTNSIQITGGSPKVTLSNVSIANAPGIIISGKDTQPTLYFKETNSIEGNVEYAAGIQLKDGASVTIEGEGEDKTTLKIDMAGALACGIGANFNESGESAGGNITIKNINLIITSTSTGIGAGENATCGDILIENSKLNITLQPNNTAAIGASVSNFNSPSVCRNITIRDSDITAKTGYSEGYKAEASVIGTSGSPNAGTKCGNINIWLKQGQSVDDFKENLTTTKAQPIGNGFWELRGDPNKATTGTITFHPYAAN